MEKIEILSSDDPAAFAEMWYELAGDDHFWVRWRFAVLLQEIRRLGLDTGAPLDGLDIGCGHGDMLRKLTASTAWRVDGCDLNRAALTLSAGHTGRIFFYNINDRRPEFSNNYDFIIMFDVIEHIVDTAVFIRSAAYHVKPGGYVFVNVPALPLLYSKYDKVVGHHRRYTKTLLREHLTQGGLDICVMRYWGITLTPIALARKLYVDRIRDAGKVAKAGFEPPSPVFGGIFSALQTFENNVLPRPPIGTSVLAIARKPPSQATAH